MNEATTSAYSSATGLAPPPSAQHSAAYPAPHPGSATQNIETRNPSDHASDMEADEFREVKARKRRRHDGPQSDGNASDSSSTSTVTTAPTQNKTPAIYTPKIPPIIVDGQKARWQQFLRDLKNHNFEFEAKIVRDLIHILTRTPAQFRQVQTHLSQAGVKFHTFPLPTEKEIKVTIRGLPHDTPADHVVDALESEGFSPTAASPLQPRDRDTHTRLPSNLFYIRLKKIGEWTKIYDLHALLGLKVTVNEFKPPRGVAQCYNCQRFGHSSVNCHLPPRCVKCAGPHIGRECTERANMPTAKCCHCNGPHPASWRGCPAHTEAMASRNRSRAPPPPPVARGNNGCPGPRQAPTAAPRFTNNPNPPTTTNSKNTSVAPTYNYPPKPNQTSQFTHSWSDVVKRPSVNRPPPDTEECSDDDPPPRSPATQQKTSVTKRRKLRQRTAQESRPTTNADTDYDDEASLSEIATTDNYTDNQRRAGLRFHRGRGRGRGRGGRGTTTARPQVDILPTQTTHNNDDTNIHHPATAESSSISITALLQWMASIIPLLLTPTPLPPAQLLAKILQSLQNLIQDGQTA